MRRGAPVLGSAVVRHLSILTVRNEGAFLLEWLAHHRAVGFDDFLIFSNDCQDGTDLMLDRLQQLGLVTHIRNDGPFPQGPQWAALKQAERHPLMHRADWVLVQDIDEFVNIRAGGHRLADLHAAMPDATAIALSWRMFGNDGVVHYDDAPVTRTFTRAAPSVLQWPWRAMLIKTLFRNDGSYRKLGVHRPKSPEDVDHQRWFDGSGRELPESFRSRGLFVPFLRDNHAVVQLNHYALGAMESYIVKCDRGRANRESSAFDMSYWVDRNFRDEEDRSILDLAPDPVEDAELARLHAAAVDWRRSRFRELMQEEPWQALFGRLLMTPPTRPLPPDQVALILRHRVTQPAPD